MGGLDMVSFGNVFVKPLTFHGQESLAALLSYL